MNARGNGGIVGVTAPQIVEIQVRQVFEHRTVAVTPEDGSPVTSDFRRSVADQLTALSREGFSIVVTVAGPSGTYVILGKVIGVHKVSIDLSRSVMPVS